MKPLCLIFDQKTYDILPSARLLLDIEDELGSLPALYARLNSDSWTAGDIVSAFHMMLESAGRSIDFMELAGRLFADGISTYRQILRQFLSIALFGATHNIQGTFS